MLEALRTYLLAAPIASTIYIGFLPASPDTAVCLRPTGGMMPDDKDTTYSMPGLQVICRAKSYQTASMLASSVNRALHGKTSYNIPISGGVHVVDIWATQSPYFIGRDDQDRSTFVQNFKTQIRES